MPLIRHIGTNGVETGKLYRHNGTNGVQIGKVFRNNGTDSKMIYNAEETIFAALSLNTGATSSGNAYQSKQAESEQYAINWNDWEYLKVTGTVGYDHKGGGTYNVSNSVKLLAYVNGETKTLATFYSGYDGGDQLVNIDTSLDVVDFTGVGWVQVVCFVQNSNTTATSGGASYCTEMTCIAI